MLLQSDVRALEKTESRSARIGEWIVISSPLVLLLIANAVLYMSSLFARIAGSSLGAVFDIWLYGVRIDICYEGQMVIAVELMRGAFLVMFAAVVLTLVAWSYVATQYRSRRILQSLKESGVLNSEKTADTNAGA